MLGRNAAREWIGGGAISARTGIGRVAGTLAVRLAIGPGARRTLHELAVLLFLRGCDSSPPDGDWAPPRHLRFSDLSLNRRSLAPLRLRRRSRPAWGLGPGGSARRRGAGGAEAV